MGRLLRGVPVTGSAARAPSRRAAYWNRVAPGALLPVSMEADAPSPLPGITRAFARDPRSAGRAAVALLASSGCDADGQRPQAGAGAARPGPAVVLGDADSCASSWTHIEALGTAKRQRVGS